MMHSSAAAAAAAALAGAALGDAFGLPFESLWSAQGVSRVTIDSTLGQASLFEGGVAKHSDDTALTLAVGEWLLAAPAPQKLCLADAPYLAQRLATAYAAQPNRGYGRGAASLFRHFNEHGCEQCLEVAASMYDGRGSYANGAAMRVAPVAVACTDWASAVRVAVVSAKVTHTHPRAILGAAIQCLAVHDAVWNKDSDNCNQLAVRRDLGGVPGSAAWLLRLVPRSVAACADLSQAAPVFNERLQGAASLVEEYRNSVCALDSNEERGNILRKLGNGMRAEEAVPAALFCACVTKSTAECARVAVALGGDTDTIASMACTVRAALCMDVEDACRELFGDGIRVEGAEECAQLGRSLAERTLFGDS